MTDLFMIVKNNMKRQKGDMVTFLVMTLISSFLIYNAFVSLFGAGKVVDKRFEEINGADEVFIIDDSEGSRDALEKALDRDEIEDYDGPVLILHGSDDTVVDLSFSRDALDYYDNARLIVINGCDHTLSEDIDKEMAYSLIGRYLGIGSHVVKPDPSV